jgi:hypothetical protein
MPVKISLSPFLSKLVRLKKTFYIIAVFAVVGLAAWGNYVWVATDGSSSTEPAITPALKLAAGTLALEKTDQAIDAVSASKLVPLWQLLAQLQNSSATAPQEIATVIDEIKVHMTSAQVEAIDGMSFSQAELGVQAATIVDKASSTQAVSAANDLMLTGGMPGGGIAMDGGGPRRSSATRKSSAVELSTSSLIDQVIQLLEKKVLN